MGERVLFHSFNMTKDIIYTFNLLISSLSTSHTPLLMEKLLIYRRTAFIGTPRRRRMKARRRCLKLLSTQYDVTDKKCKRQVKKIIFSIASQGEQSSNPNSSEPSTGTNRRLHGISEILNQKFGKIYMLPKPSGQECYQAERTGNFINLE